MVMKFRNLKRKFAIAFIGHIMCPILGYWLLVRIIYG